MKRVAFNFVLIISLILKISLLYAKCFSNFKLQLFMLEHVYVDTIDFSLKCEFAQVRIRSTANRSSANFPFPIVSLGFFFGCARVQSFREGQCPRLNGTTVLTRGKIIRISFRRIFHIIWSKFLCFIYFNGV